ncbi:MAG: acylglycerol kinase family protein, partial [Lachnospiraceae bacterium]|nr:acylglycerol kinase family protein [Lachnospiraceae bacterium]
MIHVLINPAGAGGRTVKYWKKQEVLFRESGQPYAVHLSRSEADLAKICRHICPDSLGRADGPVDLVVVGGDGTINQVLNAIPDLSAVRLGIIPCGSGNDLAKDLSLPADGREIARTVLRGEARRKSD